MYKREFFWGRGKIKSEKNTNVRPAVAFQIEEKLLRDTDDVQSGAETVHVHSIVTYFEFLGFPTECF